MGDFFACFNRYDDMTKLNKKALIDKNQRFDIGLDTNRLTHTHTHIFLIRNKIKYYDSIYAHESCNSIKCNVIITVVLDNIIITYTYTQSHDDKYI